MKINFPEGSPGIHPPTASLAKILKVKEVTNPHTGEPYSEALLLGIGGGLDAGYILFQFPHLPNPMLVLGFRNQWNHTQAFLETLTNRLNLSVNFHEYETEKAAQNALQKTLKQEKLAIVWVDKAFLPYHELPESLKGYINHQVAVYARDSRLWRLYLDDLCSQPIEIREKTFTAARANMSQNDFLVMVYEGSRDLNVQELRGVITQGIRDCVTQLTRPLKTIGISTLETWAEKLVDRHDRSGWPQVFQNQKGLFPVLRTVYESIKLNGTGGFALRKTYADFLHEAAGILNNPAFNAVAGQYLQLSNHWSILAENALPSRISDFDRIKSLLNKRYKAFQEHDLKTCKKTVQDLNTLEAKIIADFPLNDTETGRLFEKMSQQIKLISELEMSAALRLSDITRR
ncbi:MAG: DUF4872 domain-containing protein [Brevefilum sp.]